MTAQPESSAATPPAAKPSARSFVLDLLSTLRRGSMPVGALVEAGELFGIAENATRVAVTRLCSSELVERDSRGRYRLRARSESVAGRVTSWRSIERQLVRWDGSWVGVLAPHRLPRESRREGTRRARALRFLGFTALEPGLAVRPQNLRGGVEQIREDLASLGLPAGDLVFELRSLDDASETRARSSWDGEELTRLHRRLRREVDRSAQRLPHLGTERAMVQSFLLGGRVIRQLILDPLLPDRIASGAERRALLETMREYDHLGRRFWAEFLARFDVPHWSTPADTRMTATADRLTQHA